MDLTGLKRFMFRTTNKTTVNILQTEMMSVQVRLSESVTAARGNNIK